MKEASDRRKAQYELEKILRLRILNSAPEDRSAVTSLAYQELFEKFPDHSVFSETEAGRRRRGEQGAAMIRPLANKGQRILEVGCGRGDVLLELAKTGHDCFGIEPSRHMIKFCERLPGVTLLHGTADHLDFPDESFEIVFSQQVIEHLHPDDVPNHFAEVLRVLKPGGLLAIETPNRRTGPQDISSGFAKVAEGLHLKEWSVRELIEQYRKTGFVRLRGLLSPPFLARRSATIYRFSQVPAYFKYFQDLFLGFIPGQKMRTYIGKMVGLDDIFLLGKKPGRKPGI